MQDGMGGIRGPFLFGSALAIAMAVFAFFFVPEIRPESLEEEDQAFKEYLESHGYDVSGMGVASKIDEKLTEKNVAI